LNEAEDARSQLLDRINRWSTFKQRRADVISDYIELKKKEIMCKKMIALIVIKRVLRTAEENK
jgi:hypothetical protein